MADADAAVQPLLKIESASGCVVIISDIESKEMKENSRLLLGRRWFEEFTNLLMK
jgi:hypothetical protein